MGTPRHAASQRPLALVYLGNAARPLECSYAVARLLRESAHGFDVAHVGPRAPVPLNLETLAGATVYAQPGGGELGTAYRRMRKHRRAIREFVAGGGRYLGFCLGDYLAGRSPGFGLLPGDTDQYIATPGASLPDPKAGLVDIDWQGEHRRMYCQDSPVFLLQQGSDYRALAHYPNGHVAALAASFGAGRAAVVGPHPEATPDWYTDSGLSAPAHLDADLGHALIDAAMG